ncbi:MAG TPA: hypothetical protein VFA21_18595 [Pyrinomonadaceae bacterium]|nr:hypothetical protein [Pyrinomonadaceae bacterium]
MATDQSQGEAGARPSSALSNVLAKFGAGQIKAVAAQLASNTVRVDPGGATFSTIGAALASIADASQQKEYLITIGPGFYNEQVILKPFVYLLGAGTNLTVISYPPVSSDNIFNRGTVVGASNSGIGSLTANCLGGSWGDWSTALLVSGCSPFYADACSLVCEDQGNAGVNIETIAVNWNSQPDGPSQVYISYSVALANMDSNESVGVVLMANGSTTNVEGLESKFMANGGTQSFGANSNGGATVTLDNCVAQGATFALNIPDGASTLVANNCTIEGPVSNGVQVNNNPPPTPGA